MSVNAFIEYLTRLLGPEIGEKEPARRCPEETVELMWPLLEPFQGAQGEHLLAMRVASEASAEVDAALLQWSETGAIEPPPMSFLAQRLLLERLRQLVIVAGVNQAKNQRWYVPPMTLPPQQRLIAAALLWLHEMELPFPAEYQSLN